MGKIFSIPVSTINITDLGDNFLKLKIHAISDGVNNNQSNFLSESFEPSIPSFYNKPILGYYNKSINDFEEHNTNLQIDEKGNVFEDYHYEGGERPIGVIPESSNIQIEDYNGKKWITISDAIIWSDYSKQIADLIKKNKTKKVSVEVEFIDSEIIDDIEHVKLFKFNGITILGDKYNTGISDAHLTLQEVSNTETFKKYKKALCFAMRKTDKSTILSKWGIKERDDIKIIEKENFNDSSKMASNDEMGTGNALTVDKSKESFSNDSWGDVDKTKLRNDILKAKNYKSLVNSVYLKVEAGWEDSPSSNLKYPVMQIKSSKVVYNAGGLLSAQQYGEQHDKPIADEALKIRKKLGLIEPKKEEKMKKFIKSARDAGFYFVGLYGDKYRFVQTIDTIDVSDDGDLDSDVIEKIISQEYLPIFETSDVNIDFNAENFEESKMKAVDDKEADDGDKKLVADEKKPDDEDKKLVADDKKPDDGDKEFEEDDKKEKMSSEDFEAYKTLKVSYEDIKKQFEDVKTQLCDMQKAQFEKEVEGFMSDRTDMEDSDKKEMSEMAKEGKFASIEEFKKEYAYRKFVKEPEKESKIKFSIETQKKPKSQDVDALDKILNK